MMAAPPATFQAWEFHSTTGGLEQNLKINQNKPMLRPTKDQHLVQVLAAAINPVDYKPAEVPGLGRLMGLRGTPAMDFCGRIVQPADGSPLKPGQVVFGAAGPAAKNFLGGALGEYAIALPSNVAPLPEHVSAVDAASINICGITAYQSIVPYVKEGSSVFINGGSGGTGTFGIQIAKAIGCHVTTTCSTPNVEFCQSLGADEVIDYRKGSVYEALVASGRKYDLVIDNVGSDLYWKCHEYSNPEARFVTVGAHVSFHFLFQTIAMWTLPAFLGGGKRKIQPITAVSNPEELGAIAKWMAEGKVKAVIDSRFKFEEAPKAYEKLKTGRAKGKIVIDVASGAS